MQFSLKEIHHRDTEDTEKKNHGGTENTELIRRRDDGSFVPL